MKAARSFARRNRPQCSEIMNKTVENQTRPLTTKQRLFIEAYLENPNASQAALAAGYSPKTAPFIGAENLKKPQIVEMLKSRVEKAVMSANDVLTELSDIAKADWREFLQIKRDKDGNLIDASIILKDKIKALELVGKYHKLFTEKTELTGKDGGTIDVTVKTDLSALSTEELMQLKRIQKKIGS